MGILAYWVYRNYLGDTADGFNYHFNSKLPRLHRETSVGEDVFLVSLVPLDGRKEIVMLAHLVIASKAKNKPDYPYGEYRLWGDRKRSTYYSLDNPPLTPVLAELTGITHYRPTEIRKYAFSLQMFHKLNGHDLAKLKYFARHLKSVLAT